MLLRWWKQHNGNSLLGLDLNSNSVRILEIDTTKKPYVVENFSIASLPPDTIVKDEIKNPASIGNILKDLVREHDIKTKDVAIAIPRSAVIIKTILIDKRLNSSEIESRAWIEANRQFPELVGEIYLDFNVMGPSKEDANQLNLMLVACRKEQVKPYLEVIRAAGLNAKIVDVDSYALERALFQVTQNLTALETAALLNLNAAHSGLVVIHKNELSYAHDQSYDGQRLLLQVQEYIKKEGIEKINEENQVYMEILRENLISHLRHTIHFFYSSRHDMTIQKIILSGDCATIPLLALFIQKEIGVETVLANPFIDMGFANHINQNEIQSNAPNLMLCCGLALSKQNNR